MRKNTIIFILMILAIFSLLNSCKESRHKVSKGNGYARGFAIKHYNSHEILNVFSLQSNTNKPLIYLVLHDGQPEPKGVAYDQIIRVPLRRVVATSTTQASILEHLNVETSLVGFTGNTFISSKKIRQLIDSGQVRELSLSTSNSKGGGYINIENVISLQPDIVLGSPTGKGNRDYNNIIKSGISVIHDSSWLEKSPLGRAEWIKLFGLLFCLEKKADSIFKHIESNYNTIKNLVKKKIKNRPTILTGALYGSLWHVPYGGSWSAHILRDAGGKYLWEDTTGTGSLSLNFENILIKGFNADFWISPNQYTSYQQLIDDYPSYDRFQSFKNKRLFTYAKTQGPTGGLLYYEEGTVRPDIILKDLCRIFHPELLPNYKPYFYKPLD